MSYEKKQAVVRFEIGKARLDQILKPYDGSGYTVTPAGPLSTVVRNEHATVRAWADPAELAVAKADDQQDAVPATIFVEFLPNGDSKLAEPLVVSPPDNLSDIGLKRIKDVAELSGTDAKPPIPPGAHRFTLSLRPHRRIAAGSVSLPFNFRYTVLDPEGKRQDVEGKILILLDAKAPPAEASSAQAAAGVALVGGSLELVLGHLCDQEGCTDHLHKALGSVPGLVGMRPSPSLSDPRATVFVQADRSIDVWRLRETLRQNGLEIRQLTPRDFRRFELRVELCRWQNSGDPPSAKPCQQCCDETLAAVRSLAWTDEATINPCGVTIRTRDATADVCIPLDKLEAIGVAPLAVWLVLQGAPAPDPAPARDRVAATAPKTLGSQSHPLIQFDLVYHADPCPHLINALADQAWATRTSVPSVDLGTIRSDRILPEAGVAAALGDRQRADLTPLLRTWRGNGRLPTRIRLTEFGDVRIQLEFAHLCGEVEYSKPPKAKNEQPGGEPNQVAADKERAAEEKPFVPRPLRPATSSNARQAIERAIQTVQWIKQGTFFEYHTKPEFDGPRTLIVTMRPAGDGSVRIDELTRAISRAGLPPIAVRVSRLFPGIPFGHAIPSDLELETTEGERRLVSSFRQNGRPLAIAFVSLYCPNWDKYNYEADPKLFAKFKQLIEAYQDRVNFLAVSSNPDDKVAEVAECLEKAGIHIPLLNDPDQQARAIFNAQVTPPPHMFAFDADGLLRFAGDPHSNWNKPDEDQKEFLGPALDAVLARKFTGNGAVYFNSPKCDCSSANCKCPKCGCGPSCRCDIGHCKVGF